MSSLKILSGGAAQGLVASVSPKFKAMTGLDIEGGFGAVGAMADKLRAGTPTDIVVLTAAMVAGLTQENLVVSASVADIGLVKTAIAIRAGDRRCRSAMPQRCAKPFSRPTRSSCPTPGHRRPAFMLQRFWQQLGIADDVAARLKIFSNGATAMRNLAASTAARPIGCTQSTEIISTSGVMLSGSLPQGCELSTVYTAAVDHAGRRCQTCASSDRAVDRHRAARSARACGLFGNREVVSAVFAASS